MFPTLEFISIVSFNFIKVKIEDYLHISPLLAKAFIQYILFKKITNQVQYVSRIYVVHLKIIIHFSIYNIATHYQQQ